MHRSLLELTVIEMQAVCSTSTATTAHFTTICFKYLFKWESLLSSVVLLPLPTPKNCGGS